MFIRIPQRSVRSFLTTRVAIFLAKLASLWQLGLAKILEKKLAKRFFFPYRFVDKFTEDDICYLICIF